MAKKGGNPQNLKSAADMTPEERQKLAASGGKAKAENERKRKAMKEQLDILMQLPVKNKKGLKALKTNGVEDPELQDNQAAMMAVAFIMALNGSLEHMAFIRDTLGEKPANINNTTVDATVQTIPEEDRRLLNRVAKRLSCEQKTMPNETD